ncbi:BgTH12-00521 [Blumeria graminis f. sp. triticale]|uniref:BgTH12-00521 n=1 Tax=Blumeria graminis f. sp. triticale TaxID=1689686 RepID=A0A9W4DAT0_BLUGR|nr:BgTH12-00521 [Blumeria graminis f. sp. triticale]
MDSITEDRKEETQKSGPEDTLLMDTEPGGENTIYEGQQTRAAVMPSNHGQFGKCHQTISKDSWYLGLAKP